MKIMFGSCRSLKELDLLSFNTSNLTTMSFMLNGCYKLQKINLFSF